MTYKVVQFCEFTEAVFFCDSERVLNKNEFMVENIENCLEAKKIGQSTESTEKKI